MPRARYEPLNVFLNSRLVGQLRREVSGAISFQYNRSWLEWEFALPVSLSLPLKDFASSILSSRPRDLLPVSIMLAAGAW
jgi:HipA-like protein